MDKILKTKIQKYIFTVLLYVFFTVTIFLTLYPFWNLLAISFNEPMDSLRGGITFFPRKLSFINYTTLFSERQLFIMGTATVNSILRTVIVSVINTFFSALIAYAVSRKYFILRKFSNYYFTLPMYIPLGLIPTYLLYKDIGLIDNFMVYIAPHLISAFNIILMRTYMSDIPDSLNEAAKIDGASEARILFKIYLPLCMPVLATSALFVAVSQWSSWQDTLFYAQDATLTTLQYEMAKIVRGGSTLNDNSGGSTVGKPTQETLNAAITMIVTIPIIIVYPFLQRYFVHGLRFGAVKE